MLEAGLSVLPCMGWSPLVRFPNPPLIGNDFSRLTQTLSTVHQIFFQQFLRWPINLCFSLVEASIPIWVVSPPLISLCAIIFLPPHPPVLTVGRRWCVEHECEGREIPNHRDYSAPKAAQLISGLLPSALQDDHHDDHQDEHHDDHHDDYNDDHHNELQQEDPASQFFWNFKTLHILYVMF